MTDRARLRKSVNDAHFDHADGCRAGLKWQAVALPDRDREAIGS